MAVPVIIVAVALAGAGVAVRDHQRHAAAVLDGTRVENRLKMESTLDRVEQYLGRVHSDLLFISLDPNVKAMSADSRRNIQALFDHEWAIHKLSEIYVIKRDFDGTRRPFLTFERGDDGHGVEDIHSLEREEEEYRVQIEQIRRFVADPTLRAQLSREVRLCVTGPGGEQLPGLVYSLPIRSNDALVGIVAGMIPTRRIEAALERGTYANMAVLASDRGDVFGCGDLPEETRKWFEARFDEAGVADFFAKAPETFAVGEWTTLWTPVKIVSGHRWWLAFQYKHDIHLPQAGLARLVYGWGLGVAILGAGIMLALLVRGAYRQLDRAEDLLHERRRAERTLRESEERHRALFESSRDAIMTLAPPSWRFISCNPATLDMFGATDEAHFTSLGPWEVSPETQPEGRASDEKARDMIQTAMREGSHFFEWTHKRINGDSFPASVLLTRMELGGGLLLQATVRDITARKQAEMRIAASLREKEVLLREIHHRVKNNMQVIVSLLRMHSRRTDDARLGHVFDDCRDRVNAMSLIHEALYQSEDLDRIDFKVYLTKLCRNLSRAHGVSGKGIAVTVGHADVSLAMDQGIAVGMVVCELVSNAFKHAFPEGETGSVSISLAGPDQEEVELIVRDDGVGLPPEFDIFNSPSLGLELAVAAVTRELGGSIEVERDGGTRYIIRFKCKGA